MQNITLVKHPTVRNNMYGTDRHLITTYKGGHYIVSPSDYVPKEHANHDYLLIRHGCLIPSYIQDELDIRPWNLNFGLVPNFRVGNLAGYGIAVNITKRIGKEAEQLQYLLDIQPPDGRAEDNKSLLKNDVIDFVNPLDYQRSIDDFITYNENASLYMAGLNDEPLYFVMYSKGMPVVLDDNGKRVIENVGGDELFNWLRTTNLQERLAKIAHKHASSSAGIIVQKNNLGTARHEKFTVLELGVDQLWGLVDDQKLLDYPRLATRKEMFKKSFDISKAKSYARLFNIRHGEITRLMITTRSGIQRVVYDVPS